jgi:D-alanyl-lipoteichoic acid acyltransferase DltB (MBOAT superfamily)
VLFNSLTFVVFFAAVLALHALLRGWGARKRLLLGASYLFYAAWHPPYVVILAFTTIVDWWLARRIAGATDERRRKAFLVLSLAANLSMLGFFKYGGFLLANLGAGLSAAGIAYQPPQWAIVLPVGISFYVFASLSYTLDVYRRRYPANASLLDYSLFVSFFPHLVAGPIVRASMLLPQFEQPRRASPEQLGWGLALFCVGLFQKAVLADALFAPVVDAVYRDPGSYGAVDTWAAVLGFSGQIYYDFSGYSLCAIGIALCFGFEFPDNFRHPYAARGFADFWRRWHISLSSWMRDYLYIPLGGGRERSWPRNLLLTMSIVGLWHGASWMFVLWGALHGLYLVLERFLRAERGRDGPGGPAVAMTLLTFLVVTLTWIPFRAPDFAHAAAIFHGLWSPLESKLGNPSVLPCLAGIALTVLWHFRMRDSSLEEWYGRMAPFAQASALGCCLIGVFLVSGGEERAFIYFQF